MISGFLGLHSSRFHRLLLPRHLSRCKNFSAMILVEVDEDARLVLAHQLYQTGKFSLVQEHCCVIMICALPRMKKPLVFSLGTPSVMEIWPMLIGKRVNMTLQYVTI